MAALLEQWNMLQYVDSHILVLLDRIFQSEDDRLSLSEIEQYAQANVYTK